jgi:hypothetical protein
MIQRSRTALSMRKVAEEGTQRLTGLHESEALVFHMGANEKLLWEDVTHLI